VTDLDGLDLNDLPPLLREVLDHPDPWFAALGVAHLRRQEGRPATDPALTARLEGQAAPEDYVGPDVRVEDASAPGPHGPVPVRVYRPHGHARDRPMLVWNHGGAFFGGDLDMPEADATAREVCARASAVVVSADYRLAVRGVHFPVPHDDVVAAFQWAREMAQELGGSSRCVIGGASAGANLAAGAALRLRDEGHPPSGVVLAYPLVHPVLPEPSSELAARLAAVREVHAFPPEETRPMVENFLGGPLSSATPYAMAALGDLRQYPPTLIINAEYDGLRASGEAFTDALRGAGVPVRQLLARDVLHGHLNSPWLRQAQQDYANIADFLVGGVAS
jgi:acetyl esterase/lipase